MMKFIIIIYQFIFLAMLCAAPDKLENRVIYKDSTGTLKHSYNLETGDNRLMWYPQVGEKELVCDYSPDNGLAMGVFYREGDEIAGVTGRPHGELVYHLYTRTANGWKETSSSPMGGGGGLWDMKMTGTRRMLAEDSRENPLELVVTDIPLFPDSTNTLDKLILLNGQPFKPRGLGTSMAIWDQPLEKILADHEARLKAAKTKEPQKSAAEPTDKTSASEKPGEAVGKKILLPVSGPDAERGTALYWAVGGGVAAIFILAFWMRKAGAHKS